MELEFPDGGGENGNVWLVEAGSTGYWTERSLDLLDTGWRDPVLSGFSSGPDGRVDDDRSCMTTR